MPDQHDEAARATSGVSYVMPVLNDASHVRAAVESILAQHYDGPVEVLIALGPSIDGTAELVVVGIGILPTRRLAGDSALSAMLAGCAIGWISAALAGGVLVAPRAKTPQAQMQTALLAMTVRVAVVIVFGAAAVLADTFQRAPLLFWLAASYVALLPLEVRLAVTE